MNWYIGVLKQYAVFDGRSHRTEYWYFFLFNLIAIVVLSILDRILGTYPALAGIYELGVLLPSLGVAIRRLHDTNRSGWWVLIGLIPIIGAIVLIVFLATDGDAGENQYGPNPKGQGLPVAA